MKKIISLLLVQMVSATAGFAKSQPWRGDNYSIPARPDLAITWQATNQFPRQVWFYKLQPNRFSPEIISNAMTLCSFTEKDKVKSNINEVVFQNTNRTHTLSISFSSGEIRYACSEPKIRYTPTNLAVGVPSHEQMPQIAEAILGKLHIDLDDITGFADARKIYVSEPMTCFYVNHTVITNIPNRNFIFRRLVDGIPITFEFNGGNVGEHGRVRSLGITWPNLKRTKAYPTVSPQDVMDFIRRGNATRGYVPTDIGDVDWTTIKSLDIIEAVPSYCTNGNQLYPFLYLGVLVDTGSVKFKIVMTCPLIDETKL